MKHPVNNKMRTILGSIGLAGALCLLTTPLASTASAEPVASAATMPVTTHLSIGSFSSELRIDGRVVRRSSSESLNRPARHVTPNSSFPSSGDHVFTPQNPDWTFSDSNGHGSEQINYHSTSSAGLSEQWGYKLSAADQSTVNGDVHENASLYCGSTPVTGYGSHTVAPDYQFHGSKGSLTTSCIYHTAFLATWTTKSGGHATLSAQWNWYITLIL